MVLEEKDILQILQSPRNPNITDFKTRHAKLDMFYNGSEHLAEYLHKIQNFENEAQKLLRQKIARSTKDTLKKVLNPFKKVFSASGGSEELNLENKKEKEAFQELLACLPEGVSLRKWMEIYWAEAYITDPNGVILIEAEPGEDAKAYPTYKNISIIHDYTTHWNKVNYLVLEFGKHKVGESQEDIFRVIDDEKDGLYYVKDKQLLEFIPDNAISGIIQHNKGFVPAVVVSDLIDRKGGKKSFIDTIDELLDEFLRDSSVLSIYKFFHLYPKYWQYVVKCNTCKGTGSLKQNGADKACPSCSQSSDDLRGSGYNLKKDVSDGVYLPLPEDNQPKIAPDIAGFVVPPIEAWQKMVEEQERLQREMHFAIWGTYIDHEKSETATGRFIDAQPVNDALRSISESAENIEYHLAVYMARWMYDVSDPDIAISYGKRFMVEQPDQLWEKYIQAKKDKAPVSALDQHYKEYLIAQYHNDREMYDQKLKEFYIEPFVHFSFSELKGMITPEEMKKKLYFGEWLGEQTDFSLPVENLEKNFEAFVNLKPSYNETSTEIPGNGSSGKNL